MEGVGGGGMPVGFDFVVLLADVFEEQGAAADVDVAFGDLPVSGDDLAAFDVEGAALIEAAEEAEAEFDVFGEFSAEGADAVAVVGDDDLAGHGAHDAGFVVGRVEGGVGAIVEGEVLGGVGGDGPEEGGGEHFEHGFGLGVVVGTGFAVFGLLGGVVDVLGDAVGFVAAGLAGEGLAVELEQAPEGALWSFDAVVGGVFFGTDVAVAVAPVAAVGFGSGELGLDGGFDGLLGLGLRGLWLRGLGAEDVGSC